MAEETVVKEILTKEMIEAGADLTRRLDEAGLKVSASLWLYIPDSNLWRLIIASPAVRRDGPKKVYRKIQSILTKIPGDASIIPLKDISVVEDNDPLILLLRLPLRTGDGISGIRFSKNTINGHFIEDTYIYRIT
jgi:hypothetical protein